MAKMAKAAVLDKPNGTFTIQEYQVPEPAPGTFVLKTELAGVCATDAHMYHGGSSAAFNTQSSWAMSSAAPSTSWAPA